MSVNNSIAFVPCAGYQIRSYSCYRQAWTRFPFNVYFAKPKTIHLIMYQNKTTTNKWHYDSKKNVRRGFSQNPADACSFVRGEDRRARPSGARERWRASPPQRHSPRSVTATLARTNTGALPVTISSMSRTNLPVATRVC